MAGVQLRFTLANYSLHLHHLTVSLTFMIPMTRTLWQLKASDSQISDKIFSLSHDHHHRINSPSVTSVNAEQACWNFDETERIGIIQNNTAIFSNWLRRLNLLREVTLTYRKNLHDATDESSEISSLHAQHGCSLYLSCYNLILQTYLSFCAQSQW